MRRISALLPAAMALAGLAAVPGCARSATEDTQFRRWLVPYLQAQYRELPPYARRDLIRYGYALIDLNGDGAEEALVYVSGGMCGTGGCGLDVFARDGIGWRVVASTSIGYAPVKVLPTTTRGWRDLALVARMNAFDRYDARLRFDGRSYPYNPTVPPAEAVREGAQGDVVIPEATLPLFPD